MGVTGRDIQLSEAAQRLFPYSCEAKSRKSIAIYRDWEQCVHNTLPNTTPVLIIKENRSQPLAVISFDHFMELVSGTKNSNQDG